MPSTSATSSGRWRSTPTRWCWSPGGRRFRIRAPTRFGDWFQAFGRDYRFTIHEARELGDLIFIHATHGGSGRASGVEVRGENSYLYRVEDGKVARVEFYATRSEALEAAGVAE